MNRLAQGLPWIDPSGNTPARLKDLESVYSALLSIVIPGAGIVLFFIIMLGGFNLVVSGGDPGKVKRSWSTITSGALGLFLIIASYLVIRLIKQFTSVDVGNFTIQ